MELEEPLLLLAPVMDPRALALARTLVVEAESGNVCEEDRKNHHKLVVVVMKSNSSNIFCSNNDQSK